MKGDVIATRDGFSQGIVEYGKDDERVVVLDADLAHATMSSRFLDACPAVFRLPAPSLSSQRAAAMNRSVTPSLIRI